MGKEEEKEEEEADTFYALNRMRSLTRSQFERCRYCFALLAGAIL